MADEVGPLSSHRVFWAVLVGSLLLELGWVLALPAFRGADEFDHAYKADAVAHGQLRADEVTPRGRGLLVETDRDLVAAASPVCSSYRYTGPDNCAPARELGDGRVLVGSGAATYNPVYYAVVGTVARPFEGTAALVAMRVVTALLTSILLAAAAAVTARWARTTWPLLALAVACTPVLVQSAGVAAPNAVGYAAGCLVWSAALGLLQRPRAGWLLPLGLGACVLLLTHSSALLWLACVVAVLAPLLPLASWRRLVVEQRRPLVLTTVLVGATAAACVAWIVSAGTNRLAASAEGAAPMQPTDLLQVQVLWFFQTVAAFPLRNEMAPLPVYPMWWSALLLVTVLGLAAAGRRTRAAAAVLTVLWLTVPLVLTAVSFASEGYAWQGRYALPLAVGLPLLAGLALDRRGDRPPVVVGVAVLGLTGMAHLLSVVDVAVSERRAGVVGALLPSVPTAAAVVGVLALLGTVTVSLAARPGPTHPVPVVSPEPAPTGAGAS